MDIVNVKPWNWNMGNPHLQTGTGGGGTDTMYVIRMPPKNPQNKQQIKNIRTRKKNQITKRYQRKIMRYLSFTHLIKINTKNMSQTYQFSLFKK